MQFDLTSLFIMFMYLPSFNDFYRAEINFRMFVVGCSGHSYNETLSGKNRI